MTSLERIDSGYQAFCLQAQPANFLAQLEEEFRRRGCSRVYMPDTSVHTGKIAPRSRFAAITRKTDIRLLTGLEPADAVPLAASEGFALRTAGCPLLLLSVGAHFIAAHAGVKSLIDFERIRTGAVSREYEGLMHSLAAYCRANGESLSEALVDVLFAIDPQVFRYRLDDPEHGDFNTRLYAECRDRFGADTVMTADGAIDLAVLVCSIAEELGFRRALITSPLRATHGFALAATHPERNLVGVIRHKSRP